MSDSSKTLSASSGTPELPAGEDEDNLNITDIEKKLKAKSDIARTILTVDTGAETSTSIDSQEIKLQTEVGNVDVQTEKTSDHFITEFLDEFLQPNAGETSETTSFLQEANFGQLNFYGEDNAKPSDLNSQSSGQSVAIMEDEFLNVTNEKTPYSSFLQEENLGYSDDYQLNSYGEDHAKPSDQPSGQSIAFLEDEFSNANEKTPYSSFLQKANLGYSDDFQLNFYGEDNVKPTDLNSESSGQAIDFLEEEFPNVTKKKTKTEEELVKEILKISSTGLTASSSPSILEDVDFVSSDDIDLDFFSLFDVQGQIEPTDEAPPVHSSNVTEENADVRMVEKLSNVTEEKPKIKEEVPTEFVQMTSTSLTADINPDSSLQSFLQNLSSEELDLFNSLDVEEVKPSGGPLSTQAIREEEPNSHQLLALGNVEHTKPSCSSTSSILELVASILEDTNVSEVIQEDVSQPINSRVQVQATEKVQKTDECSEKESIKSPTVHDSTTSDNMINTVLISEEFKTQNEELNVASQNFSFVSQQVESTKTTTVAVEEQEYNETKYETSLRPNVGLPADITLLSFFQNFNPDSNFFQENNMGSLHHTNSQEPLVSVVPTPVFNPDFKVTEKKTNIYSTETTFKASPVSNVGSTTDTATISSPLPSSSQENVVYSINDVANVNTSEADAVVATIWIPFHPSIRDLEELTTASECTPEHSTANSHMHRVLQKETATEDTSTTPLVSNDGTETIPTLIVESGILGRVVAPTSHTTQMETPISEQQSSTRPVDVTPIKHDNIPGEQETLNILIDVVIPKRELQLQGDVKRNPPQSHPNIILSVNDPLSIENINVSYQTPFSYLTDQENATDPQAGTSSSCVSKPALNVPPKVEDINEHPEQEYSNTTINVVGSKQMSIQSNVQSVVSRAQSVNNLQQQIQNLHHNRERENQKQRQQNRRIRRQTEPVLSANVPRQLTQAKKILLQQSHPVPPLPRSRTDPGLLVTKPPTENFHVQPKSNVLYLIKDPKMVDLQTNPVAGEEQRIHSHVLKSGIYPILQVDSQLKTENVRIQPKPRSFFLQEKRTTVIAEQAARPSRAVVSHRTPKQPHIPQQRGKQRTNKRQTLQALGGLGSTNVTVQPQSETLNTGKRIIQLDPTFEAKLIDQENIAPGQPDLQPKGQEWSNLEAGHVLNLHTVTDTQFPNETRFMFPNLMAENVIPDINVLNTTTVPPRLSHFVTAYSRRRRRPGISSMHFRPILPKPKPDLLSPSTFLFAPPDSVSFVNPIRQRPTRTRSRLSTTRFRGRQGRRGRRNMCRVPLDDIRGLTSIVINRSRRTVYITRSNPTRATRSTRSTPLLRRSIFRTARNSEKESTISQSSTSRDPTEN